MNQPILAVSVFFHLVATVVWIGGLLLTAVLVWPEMRRVLSESPALYQLLTRLRKRITPWFNLSLAVLIITGLTQMALNPNYDGLMRFDNEWSRVILYKHIALVGMVICGVILQYRVVPALERLTLALEHGKGNPAEWERLRRQEVRLTWFNVVLGIMILGFSAWATTL